MKIKLVNLFSVSSVLLSTLVTPALACDWGMTKYTCYRNRVNEVSGCQIREVSLRGCAYTQVEAEASCVGTFAPNLWWNSWFDTETVSCPSHPAPQPHPAPTPQPPPNPTYFRIRNRWNPYCLASLGDSKQLDNKVGMGTCDSLNSLWRWDGKQLKNAWNPNCLGSYGPSKNIDNPIVMGSCGQSNAFWHKEGEQVKNDWNPYCLGSLGNSTAVNNSVGMGACGQTNASWYFESVQ